MSMRAILTAMLSVVWLSGCAENGSDRSNVAAMVDACEAIATTGDMYRYCMEVGPANVPLPGMKLPGRVQDHHKQATDQRAPNGQQSLLAVRAILAEQ